MKSDRFMQGILVSDGDELFSYEQRKPRHSLASVVQRLGKLKKNLSNLRYVTDKPISTNKQAVFSRHSIEGNVDEAIKDIWQRIHDNRTKPQS